MHPFLEDTNAYQMGKAIKAPEARFSVHLGSPEVEASGAIRLGESA